MPFQIPLEQHDATSTGSSEACPLITIKTFSVTHDTAARHHRVFLYPPLQLRSSAAYLQSSDTPNQSAKQQNFSIVHREQSLLAEVLILLKSPQYKAKGLYLKKKDKAKQTQQQRVQVQASSSTLTSQTQPVAPASASTFTAPPASAPDITPNVAIMQNFDGIPLIFCPWLIMA
ncbi:hypothetical protein P692DRAFT_201929396 [Suillus brevipes Sb2]|nr:hypothetical protein P692DRAFT_201929396 [Suillus brevipes Sb2]